MKKTIVERYGRKFICSVTSEIGGAMCGVSIYEEVRPNWKFFKNKYCCSESFWITEFDSILEGIVAAVDHYLEDEGYNEEIAKKWKEYCDC